MDLEQNNEQQIEQQQQKKLSEEKKRKKSSYGSDNIKVLEGLEGVRMRPAMYIGDVSITGLHHLAYEIIDNSIDEALAGYCNLVKVELHPGNIIIVEDDGRGIPTNIHPVKKLPTLEIILTSLHSGGKFDKASYSVSGGLHGVGLAVVNALSSIVKITIWREGKQFYQEFGRGHKLTELKETVLTEDTSRTGTRIEFVPDNEIFNTFDFSSEIFVREKILSRLQNMAFLNPGLRITVRDTRKLTPKPVSTNVEGEDVEKETDDADESTKSSQPSFSNAIQDKVPEKEFFKEFYSTNGLIDFVKSLNVGKSPIEPNKIISLSNKEKLEMLKMNEDDKESKGSMKQKKPTRISIAFQYCNNYYQDTLVSFVNNIATPEGGTHVQGFKRAITKAINNYVKSRDSKVKDDPFKITDVLEGLTAIISVQVDNPQFEGQTKSKLGNSDVQPEVYEFVLDELSKFFQENPAIAGSIQKRVDLALKGRIASERARDTVRRKGPLDRMRLPGKLADCSSNNREECEIFIVEGDSAGGSAKEGRDRATQAILPLRGKVLNVEKASPHKMLENKEIAALVTAIGVGITSRSSSDDEDEDSNDKQDGNENGNDVDDQQKKNGKDNDNDRLRMDKLRYDKIIILTDADVDGEHIKTLLLTLFFRFMRELITEGHVYVAVPPIYRFSYKKQEGYYYDEEKLQEQLEEFCKLHNIPDTKLVSVQRYKGLGEMNPEQLAETTMNPKTRKLRRVVIEDIIEDDMMFSTLMGTEVGPRRDYIMEHYDDVTSIDI